MVGPQVGLQILFDLKFIGRINTAVAVKATAVAVTRSSACESDLNGNDMILITKTIQGNRMKHGKQEAFEQMCWDIGIDFIANRKTLQRLIEQYGLKAVTAMIEKLNNNIYILRPLTKLQTELYCLSLNNYRSSGK